MRLLPREFWGQKWGQNPGRSKPPKTMRWRIHWAVEERGAVQACRWQRSNPYLSATIRERKAPLQLACSGAFFGSAVHMEVKDELHPGHEKP